MKLQMHFLLLNQGIYWRRGMPTVSITIYALHLPISSIPRCWTGILHVISRVQSSFLVLIEWPSELLWRWYLLLDEFKPSKWRISRWWTRSYATAVWDCDAAYVEAGRVKAQLPAWVYELKRKILNLFLSLLKLLYILLCTRLMSPIICKSDEYGESKCSPDLFYCDSNLRVYAGESWSI